MSTKKILIVDDDESILESTDLVLKEFGYESIILQDTSNIISFINKQRPDLILLDILLSGEDGRQISLKIKNSEDLKNIPVILFSAHTIDKESFKDFKADGFIEKPFEVDDLIEVIEKYLDQSQN